MFDGTAAQKCEETALNAEYVLKLRSNRNYINNNRYVSGNESTYFTALPV
jgi:hypothetical protein